MDKLITTVLTSAIVATAAGAAINAWLDSRKSKHTTRFDALNAAVALEGYALTCAEQLSKHDLALSSDGSAGSYLASVPELPEITVVAGFIRPQKATVAHRLLIFPQEVLQSDQYIAFWWEVSGIDEVRNAAMGEVAKIGLNAFKLASDIRDAFNLPAREMVFGNYDIKQSLENAVREYQQESDE